MQPRLARATEAESLTALVEAAYAPWVPIIGRRPMPMQDDYAVRIAAGQAWVLEDPPGTIGALLVLEPLADALLLDNVAVAPASQGSGLGAAMIAFAEAEAARRGVARLRLYTHALMASNIARYARLGFVETARRSEHGLARVYMEKAVAGPPDQKPGSRGMSAAQPRSRP
jgi:GNAT superfamily N-acetyltransferase